MALAAAYELASLADSFAGADVVHYADNKAANGGAVSAYSAAADLARIVSALHARWAVLAIDPWVECVKSGANLADDPTRGRMARLLAMGSVFVPFELPAVEAWGEA